VCNQRMGFVPEVVPCWPGLPWAPVVNILLLAPLLLLALDSARATPRFDPTGENRLYLWALVAALLCYPVAVALAFQLHLPSRYSQRLLGPLEWLAIGQVLGLWLHALRTRRGRLPAAAAVPLALVLLALFATPLPGYRRPDDPRAFRLLAATPAGTRLAGLSADLDFAPALLGRATVEHAIPFHRGYGQQIEDRLAITLEALSSPDPAAPAAFLAVTRTDLLVLDRALLAEGRLSPRYASVHPVLARAAEARFRAGTTALQAIWQGCQKPGTGALLLLDSTCLAARLSPPAPGAPPSNPR